MIWTTCSSLCALLQRPVTWTEVPMDPKKPFAKIAFPPNGIQDLVIPDPFPAAIKEILVFIVIESSNSTPGMRDFVRVFTKVEGRQCSKYIALHTSPQKVFRPNYYMTNSNNFWLPVGTGDYKRKMYVEVMTGSQQGKVTGEIYLTGYR